MERLGPATARIRRSRVNLSANAFVMRRLGDRSIAAGS